MPITATADLTFTVQSITINADGACSLILEIVVAGRRLAGMNVQLDADTCAGVWGGQPEPGVARWIDLRTQLYGLLQQQGVIPAEG